jgi:Fe-S cluster biogenesis protein NfuA
MMIYTEITPNPASLKFMVGQVLIPQGSADFPDESTTEDAPLAAKLFNFRFVEGVFIGNNFVTITKGDDFKWDDVIPVVKDFLKAYFESDQPVFTGQLAEQISQPLESEEDENELTSRIKGLIDSHVRPAVAMDGGDILYQGFDEQTGTVKLLLQGSCSGCPSSTITLKNGIETLLTRMVKEVRAVEAV